MGSASRYVEQLSRLLTPTLTAEKNFREALQQRYGIGERYTRAYLKYFQAAHAVKLVSPADVERLPETRRMWFDYALSTNWRGEAVVAEVQKHRNFDGARYLDIGCGFGGFLVAGSRAGATCVGIEIDTERIRFARENLADFDIPAPVHEMDALDPSVEDRVGKFDIITCNDVAEHVDSASRLFANIRRLLRPAGIAYLEIPNRYSVDFVASDGHFGLFGITLLDRKDAIAYHAERFQYPDDIGDYWSLEEYLAFLDEAGLRATLIPSLHHPTRPIAELNDRLDFLDAASNPDPVITPHYQHYRARLEADRTELDEESFRNRYMRNFWTFLVTPS